MPEVLIHIGYPKAGSTYLQSWFQNHPRMLYRPKAITGFYNAWDISKYAAKEGSLPDCYVLSCEDLSVWKGEPDIVGLKNTKLYDIRKYQEKLADILFDIYPSAKILIVTRGYTTFFPSFYSQYISGGGTETLDELENEFRKLFVLGFDYAYVIDLYRKKFGADNIILLPYELLRENPTQFTELIEAAVGVKEKYLYSKEKVNASLDSALLAVYFKVSKFLYRIIQPLPRSLQEKIYGYYVFKLNSVKPHPFIVFLSKLIKEELDMTGMKNTIEDFRGRAEILRHENLFQPYLKEYLL